MQNYNIKVTETYVYDISIKADNKNDALQKVKNIYNNAESGIFVADATTIENTKFTTYKE
uniref:Uncharacterized protein n=1 Tax=viral metagenome TaxID=1070528 RepID=A0A6H1ZZI1_9ZZZZ